MKTIIELREEAIKQDKNIEFYLYQLLEEKENIIKEAREYIEEHSEMTDLQINGIENVLAFRGSCKKLLEILDKVGEE